MIKRARRTGIYPSMTALRTLDAIARLGSMNKAAELLFVTPSAVSHQVRILEDLVGVQLIQRIGRKVELTSAGYRYAVEVRQALAIVGRATMALEEPEAYGALHINCASGFGTYWLAPNMGEFQKLHPNIDLHVRSSADYDDANSVDAYSDDFDFSVLYGDGAWDGLEVQLLYNPVFFPVCSPRLIETHGWLKKPDDVLGFPLIHHTDRSNWAAWLSAASKKSVTIEGGTLFSDVTHSINAAVAGHGIAIGDDVLAGQAIKEGRLIRPFATEIPAPRSYYIVTQREKRTRRVAQAGINWLVSEFAPYPLLRDVRGNGLKRINQT